MQIASKEILLTTTKTLYPCEKFDLKTRNKLRKQMRSIFDKNNNNNITGHEMLSLSEEITIPMGHFALSEIMLWDQDRSVEFGHRIPRKLVQSFSNVNEFKNDELKSRVTKSRQNALLNKAKQNASVRIDAKSLHIIYNPSIKDPLRDHKYNINTLSKKKDKENKSISLETKIKNYKRNPLVPGCTIDEIQAGKYLIKYGIGVTLTTILPFNSNMDVAKFASWYIYSDNARRLKKLKRFRSKNIDDDVRTDVDVHDDTDDNENEKNKKQKTMDMSKRHDFKADKIEDWIV